MHLNKKSAERLLQSFCFFDMSIFIKDCQRQPLRINFRTCPHRANVRIFRHNFVGDKAKIRWWAVALQGFLTQSLAKFDEKTCMNPYVDRFLNPSAKQTRYNSQSITMN